MPPMQIRDAAAANAMLGPNPLPNGFVSIPINTFINPDINDQLSWGGCPYAEDTVNARRYDNGLYDDFWWVANFSR